ncbi:hypothetical protein GQ43DRAFT_395478 [Delitschia confertaspora ATCC 74209]|uniref:Uncharacterized protein n=1 Tax=Delitschia confertaspora ATCC 74209 TaxID=1513339 RepID=A0A9P4JMB0_9PLEO|nr:hypothetical protein GQ43DRAFT_395478 [Delitschia confertaspora ATCC 74209]
MSSDQNPLDIAKQAEKDLNSYPAKHGHDLSGNKRAAPRGTGDSTLNSGIDDSVQQKFPGSSAIYGSSASCVGDNCEIPLSDGGDIKPGTDRLYKSKDFEGAGGPEDKRKIYEEANPGAGDVGGNVR